MKRLTDFKKGMWVGIKKFQFWGGLFLLAVLIWFVYHPAIHGEWLWDDDEMVSVNPFLRTPQGLYDIWFKPGATSQYYPFTFTVFWLQYQVWGLEPAGYHLVNILLHFLNVFLAWQIFKRLGVRGAYGIALIFAVHPVCVETVAWISELKNLLLGVFYFLSLLCYFQHADSEDDNDFTYSSGFFYGLSLLFFIVALLSKTVAVSLPVVILLLVWWRSGRIAKKVFWGMAPFFLIGALAAGMTIWCERAFVGAQGEFWAYTFWERLIIAGRALWFYPSKIFWPRNLNFFYELWEINSAHPGWYLPVLTFGFFLTCLFVLRHRIGRGPFTAVAFYFLTIFPALGFFDIETMRYSFVADHYQYLACLGWISLLVSAGVSLVEFFQKTFVRTFYLFIFIITGLLAVLAHQQAYRYRSPMDLYQDVISKNSTSWLSLNNIGCLYSRQNRYATAVTYFDRAIEIYPEFYLAYYNRAICYLYLKQYDQAFHDASKASQIKPTAEAAELQGLIYFEQGIFYQALQYYDMCLSIDPKFRDCLIGRQEILKRQSREQR